LLENACHKYTIFHKLLPNLTFIYKYLGTDGSCYLLGISKTGPNYKPRNCFSPHPFNTSFFSMWDTAGDALAANYFGVMRNLGGFKGLYHSATGYVICEE